MSEENVNVYVREKLYDEIWNSPIIQVSETYGVSNVAIHKICKSMNIPTPPNGYWAKLKAGKKVEKKPPLPEDFKRPSIRYGYDPNSKEKISTFSPLSFLEPQEQEIIYRLASTLRIDLDQRFSEELLTNKITIISDSRLDINISITFYEFIINYNDYSDTSYCSISNQAGYFSKLGLIRAFGILNTVMNAVKELGHTVNSDLSFNIHNERINYTLNEKYILIDHVITQHEAHELAKYEKSHKRNIYVSQPTIPLNDYKFTGNLLFYAKKNSFIKDSQNAKLEDKLDRILIQLFQQSNVIIKERFEKEEKVRREREEWHQRNLPALNFNVEIEQLNTLFQEIQDFEIAERIRTYVDYVQQKDYQHKKADWISWANAKADWYDPTIHKNDNQFGERKHDADPIPEKKTIYRW